MGTVIIPCWRRPAFLAATLRCIERARGADAQQFVFAIDRDPDLRVLDVIHEFKLPSRKFLSGKHPYPGPRFNILCALRDALHGLSTDDFVGVIEDDILVAEDIFEFWRDALALDPVASAVSACRNQMRAQPVDLADNDPSRVIYRDMSYQSLAVALRRELLIELVEHVRADYFRDPISYCNKHLPDPGLEQWEASQDGLIHRIVRRRHFWTLYPVVPRACHIGWVGYNRDQGHELAGSWRDNAERILEMTSDQMNELADPRFRDIERCQLIRSSSSLVLI